MTEVTFHHSVADKVGYVCRAVRQISGKGNRIVITGSADALREIDVALWTFDALEFLPHCYAAQATPEVLASSPVVLSDTAQAAPHRQVLVNLGPGVPEGFERFERLVEVVSEDEADRQDGRLRAKHYKDRGYPLRMYNVVTKETR